MGVFFGVGVFFVGVFLVSGTLGFFAAGVSSVKSTASSGAFLFSPEDGGLSSVRSIAMASGAGGSGLTSAGFLGAPPKKLRMSSGIAAVQKTRARAWESGP